MGREREADFSQGFLLPPSVEDWVGPEHPARFIRSFVDALDLEELGVDWIEASPGPGRPAYSASLLLRVWLYGYFMNQRSTRKLEAACREHMGLIWLSGMLTPDHNTLWRFFSRNKKALRNLFSHSVKVAVKAQMVGMVVHALDGTKVGAKAATGSRVTREQLQALLDSLEETVSAWEEHIEETAAPEEPGTGLPEELQDERRLRDKVRAALAELDADEKLEQVHPDDPQARVMACKDVNAKRLAYNSQAVVDDAHGILVACAVNTAAADQGQLTPMLNATEEELGACADVTLADAGYATGQAFRDAEETGRTILVNLPPRMSGDPANPYHASHFTHDPDAGTVTCPRGEELTYKHTRYHRGKDQHLRLYRCENKTCPVRAQCTKDRKGRGIELGPHHAAITRQKQRQRDPAARHQLSQRAGLIERVFATIKQTYGFRRYTRHGLDNVTTEWALICTTYNLQKLYRRWKKTPTPTLTLSNLTKSHP